MSQLSEYFADLSNNNSRYDASTYRKAGHVIVALKASEGTSFADFRHRGWALASGLHHVAVVHYHFGRPDRNPGPTGGRAEAEWFLHVTRGLLGPHDYVVYDGERAQDGSFGLDPGHAAGFDQQIQRATRFHTILYASASELAERGQHALIGNNKRDWCADYSTRADTHAPGHTCVMRQFTDGVHGPEPHQLPGVNTGDINVLRGSLAQHILQAAAAA